jgi:competence protein ComEA
MDSWLGKYRIIVLIAVALFVASGMAACAFRWQPAAEIIIQPPPPTATPGPVRVHVSGAVVNPGVYTLPPDSIAQDALQAAGGPTDVAALDYVNLAQELSDNMQLRIPAVGESVVSDSGEVELTGPVNINTATQEQLELLPDIGPVTAGNIIAYREENGPFEQIEDIMNVPGIGEVTFEGLRDQITVGN